MGVARKAEAGLHRVPVHIVTGAPGSGKSALIARLTGERKDWLGLVNAVPDVATDNLRALSAGCPCCTGRMVLQVSLVRALRDSGASRALVELSDPAHASSLEKLLQAPPFSLSLRAARALVLPRDVDVSTAAVAEPDRSDDPGGTLNL